MDQENNSLSTTGNSTPVTTQIRQEGAGKAYQAVAQSTAIAVQDATDNLRNVSTISATALGVAMAQLLATGEPKYVLAIEEAQKIAVDAANNFKVIGINAADVLKAFPSGQ